VATAGGGIGGLSEFLGSRNSGGEALSHATVQGLGEVVARADSRTAGSAHSNAQSDAETLGPIVGVHAALDTLTIPPSNLNPAVFVRFLDTEATLRAATAVDGAVSPALGRNSAFLFAAPQAADVATWTGGNANAQAALAVPDAHVLALGTVAGTSRPTDDGSLTGRLAVDLDGASHSSSTQLAIAFLDPTADGSSLDLLHLRFEVDGATVFDESFTDTASALAGLDDELVSLGALGASANPIRTLVLSFELDFIEPPADGSFALDFALLATPEPTPGLLVLAAAAVFGLARVSRRSGALRRSR
jgi:hypothetical protein